MGDPRERLATMLLKLDEAEEEKMARRFRVAVDDLELRIPLLAPLEARAGGLAKAFMFYWLLEMPMRGEPPNAVMLELQNCLLESVVRRLSIQGGRAGLCPRCIGEKLRAKVRELARDESIMFDDLGADLTEPTIEAFASGSLHLTEDERSRAAERRGGRLNDYLFHDPNSALYFTWFEFALCAARDAKRPGHGTTWGPAEWRRLAAMLLRSHHIFAKSYAELDVSGKVVPGWTFSSYHPDRRRLIDPAEMPSEDYSGLTIDELDERATDVAKWAMPGGVGGPTALSARIKAVIAAHQTRGRH